VREFLAGEYRLWNVHGDSLVSAVPRCLTDLRPSAEWTSRVTFSYELWLLTDWLSADWTCKVKSHTSCPKMPHRPWTFSWLNAHNDNHKLAVPWVLIDHWPSIEWLCMVTVLYQLSYDASQTVDSRLSEHAQWQFLVSWFKMPFSWKNVHVASLVSESHVDQSKRHRLWFSRKTCSCFSTKTHVNGMILILKLNLTSLRNIYIKSGICWAPHTI